MFKKKNPILLSFCAVSNGHTTLVYGQISYFSDKDISFKDYSWHETFRNLLRMYRAKALDHEEIELEFNQGCVKTITDGTGGFFTKVNFDSTWDESQMYLKEIKLLSGEKVKLVESQYSLAIHQVEKKFIIISDIDDTLIHSYIHNTFLKFRTLSFTRVEKRKAVITMMNLIKSFALSGAAPFYLSNSERNLYPLINRFLMFHQFPKGPIFLKPMRKIRHVLANKKIGEKDQHKLTNLKLILTLFPDKKFIFMGDNTQNDLKIYLSIAKEFPKNIRYIIIRQVFDKPEDEEIINNAQTLLRANNIDLFYANHFPKPFEL